MPNVANRGHIEMRPKTYQRYSKYMKQFNGETYYTSYPVRSRTAKENVIVDKQGNKTRLCF